MKTLTELSGILVRKAAAAVAEAKRSLPKEAPPAPAEVPAAEAPAAEPAAEGAVEAPAAAAPPASPAKHQGPPAEVAETEAVKAALDAAVSAATGVSGDRLERLRDAVKVVGGRVEDVRLVRVFGPEEAVPGAKLQNGFQYLVDVAPASMRQVGAPPKKERFGGRGGDKGGRGGGGGGKGAPASGGFSMDSLKDDRKNERGGPGRGKPGGGKPGGGGPRR